MAGPQTYNINKRIASLKAGLLKVDELMKNHAQLQTDYEDLNNKYLLLVEREGKTRKLVAKCTQLMKENAEMKQQLQSSDALSEELEKWKLEHEKVSQCLEMYKQQVNVMHMEENCKFNRTDLIKLCHELFQCRNKTKQVACLWKTFYKKYREELIYHRLPILKIEKCKMKKLKKEEPFEEDDLTTDLTQLHSVESGYHESDSVVESTGSLTSKCDSKLDQNLDEQDLAAIYDTNEDINKVGWLDDADSRDSCINDLENNLSKDDTDFVSHQNGVEPLVNIPNGVDDDGLSNHNLPVDLPAKELPDISNGLLVNISENFSKSTEFFKDCVVSEINNSPVVEHLFSPGCSVSAPTVEQIGELFETCKISKEKSEVETGQNQHLDSLHFSYQKDYPLEVQSFVHVPEVNSEKEPGEKQVQSEECVDSEAEDSDDLDDLGKLVEEQIVNHQELRNQEVQGAEDTVDLQELVSMYQVPAPISPIHFSPPKRRRKKKNLRKDQTNSATKSLCGVGSIFSPPASHKSLDRNQDECNLGALVSNCKKNEEKSGKELECSEKTCRTLVEHKHENQSELNLQSSKKEIVVNSKDVSENVSNPKIGNIEGQKENDMNLESSANICSKDVENFTSSSSPKVNDEGHKENKINLESSANILNNDAENFTSSSCPKVNKEGQEKNEILESSAIILSKDVENSEDRISKKLKRKYKNKERRDIKRKKKIALDEELLKKLTKLTEKLEKEKKCSKKRNNSSILLRGNRLKGYSSSKQRGQFSWDVEDLQEEMVDDVNNKETITVENNLEEKQNEHLTNLELCKNLIEAEQSEISEHSGKNSLEILKEQYKIATESGDEELAKNCVEDLRKNILLVGKEPCNTFERPLEEVPTISQEEENFEADKSENKDDFAQILQNDSLEDLERSSLLFDGEEPFKNFDQLMEEEAAGNQDEKNCKEDKDDVAGDLEKTVQDECSQYAEAVPYRPDDMRLGNQEQSINTTGPGFSSNPDVNVDGLVIEKNFPPEIQSPDRRELPDNSTHCIEYFSGNESDGEPSGKLVTDAQKNLVSKKSLDVNYPKTTVEESAINQGKNFSVNDVENRTVLAEALRLLQQQLFPIASDVNSSSGVDKNLEQPILTSDPLTRRVLSEAVDVNSLSHVEMTLGKEIKRSKTSVEICPAKTLKQKISEKLPKDVDKNLCSVSGSYSTSGIQKTMNKTLSENVRKNAGSFTGLVAENNPPPGVKIPGQKILPNNLKNCKDRFSKSESDGESSDKLVIDSQEDLASEKSLDVNFSVISSHTYQLRSKRLPLDDKSNKVVSSGNILKKLRGRPRKISPPKKASKPPDIAEPQPENKKIVPRKTVPDESSCKNDFKICDKDTSSPQKYSADYSPVPKRSSRGVKTPIKRRRIEEDESDTDQEEPFRKNLTLLIDEREKREVRKINKKPPENSSVSENRNLPVPDGNLNASVLKPIVSPVISPDANSDPIVQFSGKQPRKRVARDKSECVKSGEMCADCLGPCVGTCKEKLIVTEDTHKMSLRSVKANSTLKSVPASGTLSSDPKNLDVDTSSSPKVSAEVKSREEEAKSAGNSLLDSILTKMTTQQKVFKCDTPRRVATVLPVFVPEEGKSHFHETSIVPSLPGDKAKKGLSPSVFTNIGDIEIKELGGSAKEEGSAPPTLKTGQKCAKKVYNILVDYVESDVRTPEESNKAIKDTLYSLLGVHEEVIARVTVQLLLENVDEDIINNEPPNPPMTKTQTKLFVLLCFFPLKSRNHQNIKRLIRQIIWEKLLPENFSWPDDSILSCARFYTALCKHDNDLSGIWKFFFSALIEMPKRFPLVICTILLVWPDILHDAEIMKSNIINSKMAAVQLILSTVKTDEQRNPRQIHKLFIIKELLVKHYKYDLNSNFEEYLKNVMEEFGKENKNKNSKKCLSLIIKVRKWDWTKKKIIPELLEFVKSWAHNKVSDWIGNTSLELLRVASEKVPKNIAANDIRDCLVNILESKEVSHEKEEMIVETLISFKDSTNIEEILNSWIPKKAITPSLEKKIIWAKTAKKKGPLNSNETFPGGKPKENIPKTYNNRNITPNNNSNMNKKKKKKKNKKKNEKKAGNNINSENTNVDATPGSDETS